MSNRFVEVVTKKEVQWERMGEWEVAGQKGP